MSPSLVVNIIFYWPISFFLLYSSFTISHYNNNNSIPSRFLWVRPHGGTLPSAAAAGEDASCTVCLENVHGIGCHVDER